MTKHLAYIDQNIIGLQIDGRIKLRTKPEIYWVYSKEHFSEIKRSVEADKYLKALRDIDAKLLSLEVDDNWKITGNASLSLEGTPHQHYDAYLEATGEVDFDEHIFDPLQAWINGGGDSISLGELPDRFHKQLFDLLNQIPWGEELLRNDVADVKPELDELVAKLTAEGNDISKTRGVLGLGKGVAGSVTGENIIHQIWEIVEPVFPELTCDQFFGFDPTDTQGYEIWPRYLGIVGCCAVMDIIGFQAEKKCRKIEKLPNIRSDASHIAMGAFCSGILSADKRLVKRAQAIYEYKKIPTEVFAIELHANKRMQPDAAEPRR